MPHDVYESPLNSRYASREMSALWSDQAKHSTWRRIWVALAESQNELGLDVTRAQVEELRARIDDIDFEAANRYERNSATTSWRTCTPIATNVPVLEESSISAPHPVRSPTTRN